MRGRVINASFSGVYIKVSFGGRAKESVFSKCIIFRNIDRSFFLEERAKESVSPEALLRIELIA